MGGPSRGVHGGGESTKKKGRLGLHARRRLSIKSLREGF